MPKINELPRASTLAATDLLAKDNTSGTSTEGVSAQQVADFVKGTIPAPDSAPTTGSTNTVTSGGVKTALDAKQNSLTFDSTPTAGSNNPVTSAGIKAALDAKQNTLTFDNVPTNGSNNPVKSDGVFDADEAIRTEVADLKTQINIIDLRDGEAIANGTDGSYTDSNFSVTKSNNIVTFNGTYTASTRRRFKLSGEYDTTTSSIPSSWYSTPYAVLPEDKTFTLNVIEESGAITFPFGDTGYGMNILVYDTSDNLIIAAYRYSYGWVYSRVNHANKTIGLIVVTVNKNYTFSNYRFSVYIEAVDYTNLIGYVDGTNGDDTRPGSELFPVKSIGQAITLGYRHIMATPNVYNEKISATDGEFVLIPWVENQSFDSSVPYRPKIELIYGDELTLTSAGNNIYTAPYTAASGTNMYKVFVGKTVAPTTEGSLSLEYNAMLIGDKPNGTKGNNRKRLYMPVLTETELSDPGTYFYDGTTIKIHPWDNVLDDNYYIPNDSADIGLELSNMKKVHLEDVRILGFYNYCAYLHECDDVTIDACEFAYSGKGMGLGLDNCNAHVNNCHASACSVDGFNLHEYGYSEFIDCTAFYCGDDGLSHHQGCSGIISGGEYAYCGSGGVTPAYGCTVDVSGVYCHDNKVGLQFLGSSGNRRTLRCSDCLLIGNTQSDLYAKYYDIISWNCAYNVKEIGSYATITEYNNTVLT